jgi:excisionase family DNA binding protein
MGQLLTAEQLAVRWQVPKSHVYRLAREKKIPVVELGRYKRIRLDSIEQFEESFDSTTTEAGESR